MIKDRLQTKGNLVFKNWMGDPRCVLCRSTVESTAHLFVSCEETNQVWSLLFGYEGLVTLDALLNRYLSSAKNDFFNLLFPTTSWSLWRERNQAVFRDATFVSANVARNSLRFLSFWLNNSKLPNRDEQQARIVELTNTVLAGP